MARQPRTISTTSAATAMANQIAQRLGQGYNDARGEVLRIISKPSAQYIGKDLLGRSMYRVSYVGAFNRRTTQVVSWDGKKIHDPQLKPIAREGGIGEPNVPTGGSGIDPMPRIKDNALAWLATNSNKLAATDVTALTRAVRDWSGKDPGAFHDWWAMTRRNLPALTGVAVEDFSVDDSFLIGGGGGGGGGGFAGPSYRAPDRRVVEDFVKGSLVSLVGNIPAQYVDTFTEIYMKDHRKNFDSLNKEIDPQQSVTEAIRKTAEYKTIHSLRPKGVDERSWVADRKSQASQGGLNTDKVEDFAITQATVGGDIGDVAEAAAFTQLQNTGQAPAFLQTTFRNAVQGLFQGVGR